MICHILGVPLEDEPQFHHWIADAMAGVFDLGPEIETEEGQVRRAKGDAASNVKKYIIALVERAEKSPSPGMISQLVHDDGPDGPMSPSEIVNNTILLFVAGHDSTVNLISHCVLTVLRNPGSVELLRSRPELIPGAIEEVLRLQSSVQFFPSSLGAGRHRDRRHDNPQGITHLPDVRRGQPRPEALPRPQHLRPRTQR